MSLQLAQTAADAWGGQVEHLIAQRENAVYRVLIDGKPFALRLHRAGYQTADAIKAELTWTTRLAHAGFACPQAVPAKDGAMLVQVDKLQASVISWVDGAPIGASDDPFEGSVQAHCDLYARVGALLGQLHNTTDKIKTDDLTRPAWDINGLLGKNPFWGKFWENPSLAPGEKKFLTYTRDAAKEYLHGMKKPDYGLIHADALQENVFQTDAGLVLLDFDDSGFGFRGFDLGVAVSQHYQRRYLGDLIAAIRDGYATQRPAASAEDIAFFQMLRGFASCGWVIPRHPKKSEVQRRFAERAIHLAHVWMTKG